MLSVVFTTRDRVDTLPQVLTAFAAIEPPPGGWRLIVVDNGSADATPYVLQAFERKLPLRVVREAVAGKNRALNRALEAVAGDLVVFTDDDVLPDPRWLCRLRAAADRHPDYTLFGGTILPHWPGPRPHWLAESHLDFGVLYCQLRHPTGPCENGSVWGPNMAIRRAVFDAGFRFDPTIGPDASQQNYAMGSETELNARLGAAGMRAWFDAEAVVRHMVRPEQLSARWVLARADRHGFGVRRYAQPSRLEGRPLVRGMPHRLLTRRMAYGAMAPFLAMLPRSRARMRLLYRAHWIAGLADAVASGAAPGAGRLGQKQSEANPA